MLKKFLHTTSLLAVTSSAAFWAVAAQAAPGGGIQKTSYAPATQAASTNAALTETSQLGSPANSGTAHRHGNPPLKAMPPMARSRNICPRPWANR